MIDAMRKLYGILGLFFLALAGCESLESTYDEYTGDGPVRYVGACTDVAVESGWNRITVKWTNSLDPNIVENLITCTAETFSYDTTVAANVAECEIRGLADATYTVTVQGVDEQGNKSLAEPATAYGRPYTYAHEAVMGFTRGISKHFFVRDNLVLFFNTWDSNIIDFTLHYTGTDGEPKTYALTEEESAIGHVLLEGVDAESEVVLKRRGRIAECPDEIDFEDYVLTDDPVLMSAFKLAMQERYGVTEFGAAFLSRTDLELDYDIVSMEDILAFPNLERLVLGKNRYMGANNTMNLSEVSDYDESLWCIGVMKQLNPDFVVERYNEHYFPSGTANVTDMGSDNLEDLERVTFLPTEGWSVTCEPQVAGFESAYLLDDDPASTWRPLQQSGMARSFELTIDMKAEQAVDGVKVVQANVTGTDVNFFPMWANVEVSTDNVNWQSVTYVEDNTLGTAPGEATLVRFTQTCNARYIKVTVEDRRFDTSLGSILGDLIPYRN